MGRLGKRFKKKKEEEATILILLEFQTSLFPSICLLFLLLLPSLFLRAMPSISLRPANFGLRLQKQQEVCMKMQMCVEWGERQAVCELVFQPVDSAMCENHSTSQRSKHPPLLSFLSSLSLPHSPGPEGFADRIKPAYANLSENVNFSTNMQIGQYVCIYFYWCRFFFLLRVSSIFGAKVIF